MATLEEMTAWTIEDIQAEIAQAMPPGWIFDYNFDMDRSGWWAKFQDASETVVWDTYAIPDQRLLLFNAYGWLTLRSYQPRHPAWAIRKQPVPKPIIGQHTLPGVTIPDPEDLNPTEIDSVYKSSRNTSKR